MADVPSERADAALRAGRALGAAGHFREAWAILESVPDPDLRIEAELAASGVQLASYASAALTRVARHCDTDLPGPGRHFMQVMLAHRSIIAGESCSVAEALLDRALAGSEMFAGESLVTVYAAMDLVLTDRLDGADRLCTACIEEGRRRGSLTIVSSFAFPRAFASLRRGRLRDAEADGRLALEGMLALVPRSETGPAYALAFLVDALTDLGNTSGADEALARIDTPDGKQPEILAWAFLLEARGRLRIAQGRLREGLDDLRDAARRWEGCAATPPPLCAGARRQRLHSRSSASRTRPDASPPTSSSSHGLPACRAWWARQRGWRGPSPRARTASSSCARRSTCSAKPPLRSNAREHCSSLEARFAAKVTASKPATTSGTVSNSPTARARARSRHVPAKNSSPPADARASRSSPASTR